MSSELSYSSANDAPVVEPKPQSFFSRWLGVYFSPGETFQEIGQAPRLLAPMLVLMLIGSLGGYLMIERIGVRQFFSAGFEQAVANNQMTQEDADKQLDAMTNGVVGTITKYSFPLVGLLQPLIMGLVLAGLGKLITTLMGGENKFKPLYSVTLFALLAISVIQTALLLIVIYLKPVSELDINNLVGSNLAALLSMIVGKDGLPKFIMTLGRWLDVFLIWLIALLAIGYGAVSKRIKTGTFATGLGLVFGIFALLAAGWAALRG